jgi:hypothetical protein
MGECTYFFKAQFKNKTAAKEALPKIRDFLTETKKAYNFWQNNRFSDEAIPYQKFWKEFTKQFPTTTLYLKTLDLNRKEHLISTGRTYNGLAGKLDFSQYDDDIKRLAIYDETVICYEATDVWHLSDWNIHKFFKETFGATRVVVANDDSGVGCLENLNLYEYEDIVKALVKRAKEKDDDTNLLALLKGIHSELDILLDS